MARAINRLDSKKVENAKPNKPHGKPTLLPDGGNLYLQVSRGKDGTINKSWLFKYQFGFCRHELGLGPYPQFGLARARELARDFSTQIVKGIDPIVAKREAKAQAKQAALAARAEKAKIITFRKCCDLYLAKNSGKWKNPKHAQQWRNTLKSAYPVIGDLAVSDITTAHIIKVLEPIWYSTTETASRLRGRIENVLGFATVSEFRSGDNPARWRGHLKEVFPARNEIQKVEHHEALPYDEVPQFMAELRIQQSTPARALEFAILTAARTGEIVGATWDEIDLKARVWVISAERMKADPEHRVPLSDRAVAILEHLPHKSDFVFPASNNSKIPNKAMLNLLNEMRPGDFTVHGFRSTFRDWVADRTNFPGDVAEMALAHAVGDAVEKAYRRTDHFVKRTRLMKLWADFCAKPLPKSATVTQLHGAAAR